MSPLISVIVPIYKVEQYLDRCVRSIAAQTCTNLEIILVDDGSPDNCPTICDTWAEKDSRIKVIHKENGGLSDARNAGLVVASGEYISFIDSDDWIEPTFLETLLGAMARESAQIAECATKYVAEDGSVLRIRASEYRVMGPVEALRRLVLEDGVYQTVWNKLYRRDMLEGIRFEKGKYNEDEFWTYQIMDRAGAVVTVSLPLYNYLQRNSSIIGVGYNIRRLDGLEARFQRMQYLQKHDELAALTRQNLMLDCMWHYQSAKVNLQGDEKVQALAMVREMMKNCPRVPLTQLTGKLTHKIWYLMFKTMPNATVWVRKKIGIGA